MQKIADFFKDFADGLFSFFQSITDAFSGVIDFVASILNKIKEWIDLVGESLTNYSWIVNFYTEHNVPAIVITLCVVATTVWIITRIGGRE